eukprot:gene10159-28324_t
MLTKEDITFGGTVSRALLFFHMNAVLVLCVLGALVCSAAAAEKERDAEGPIREGWSHPILRATLEIETMPFEPSTPIDPQAAANTAGSYNEFAEARNALKHQPFATVGPDRTLALAVRGAEGSTAKLHPMDYAGHHISFIYAKDQDGNIVCKHQFDSEVDVVPVHICQHALADTVTEITPYQYCNLHGVWQGPTYNVPFEQSASEFTKMGLIANMYHDEAAVVVGAPVKHEPAVVPWSGYGGDGSDREYHIVVRGAEGSSESLHPMKGKEHHIEAIWAKDQHGKVIAFETLGPTARTPSGMPLQLTAGTRSVTPFEYCNLHGYWAGEAFAIPPPPSRSHAEEL